MCINPFVKHSTGVISKANTLRGKKVGDTYSTAFSARCGSCIACIRRTQSEWAVRTHYENLGNPAIYHITLTYADASQDVLNYSHTQDFHKRLRKYFWTLLGRNINYRFILGGEYGENLNHPHYHVLVFGELPLDDLEFFKISSKSDNEVYRSKTLESIWGHGIVGIVHVNTSTSHIAISNYMHSGSLKQNYKDHRKLLFWKFYNRLKDDGATIMISDKEIRKQASKLVDEHKEKCISSLGIGFKHFLNHIDEYKQTDGVYIQGVKLCIPMSWLDKLADIPEHKAYAQKLYNDLIDADYKNLSIPEEQFDYIKRKADEKAHKKIIQFQNILDDVAKNQKKVRDKY